MEMELIGQVPLDKEQQLRIFSQLQQEKKYINEVDRLKSNHMRI